MTPATRFRPIKFPLWCKIPRSAGAVYMPMLKRATPSFQLAKYCRCHIVSGMTATFPSTSPIGSHLRFVISSVRLLSMMYSMPSRLIFGKRSRSRLLLSADDDNLSGWSLRLQSKMMVSLQCDRCKCRNTQSLVTSECPLTRFAPLPAPGRDEACATIFRRSSTVWRMVGLRR